MSETGSSRRRKRAPHSTGSPSPVPAPPGVGAAALASLDTLAGQLRAVDGVKELVAALIAENGQLRAENLRLNGVGGTASSAADGTSAHELLREKAGLYRAQLQELLDAHAHLAQRLVELDWANASMMNMYVASLKLHASLDADEVLRVIEEILVNFIGVRSWAVLLRETDATTFRVARESGLEGRLPSHGIEPTGVLADALRAETPYFHPTGAPSPDEPLAVLPLGEPASPVGAIFVYTLLAHKEMLGGPDLEMFSLLAGHATSALTSALLFQKASEKARRLESVAALVG